MARSLLLTVALSYVLSVSASGLSDAAAVCQELQSSLSSASAVFYPNSTEYVYDTTLPASFFNRANATCVVEPGSNEDAALVMTSIRNHNQAPFGVMGWGHNLNKLFSSTTGVLVALNRFNQLNITDAPGPNNQVALVNVGPGLSWDQVYAKTVPQGVNVVGGRFATVGVSGLSLGGGYSWISNEHALACDNVASYTLISPNDSSILEVNNSTYPDLFFALKGGLNNFGIVTNFQLMGYNQTNKVWAGTVYTQPGNSDAVAAAFANFSVNNTDPKAQLIGTFAYGNNSASEVIVMFYNGEEEPSMFNDFLSIPQSQPTDWSLRTFDNFTSASLATVGFLNGGRTRYSTLAVEGFPTSVVKTFQSQRDTLGPKLNALDPKFFGSWTIEPFIHSYWDTAVSSAAPHSSAHVTFPPNIEFTWYTEQNDQIMFDTISNTTQALVNSALAAGQNVSDQIIYPNYAMPQVPVEHFYGDNLPRLRQIRSDIDPYNVMSRAGGYKIN